MAYPNFQAAGSISQDTSGSASVTPTLPSHAADDILLCIAWAAPDVNGAALSCSTSGWAQITQLNGGLVEGSFAAWWKRATSGSETNPTVTCDYTDVFAVCYAIRGCVTSGTPYEGLSSYSLGLSTASTQIYASGTTSSGTERLAVMIAGVNDDTGWSTAPPPSGWTTGSDLSTSSGTDCRFTAIWKQVGSGSVSGETIGTLSDAEYFASFSVCFKPVPSGTTYPQSVSGSLSFSGTLARQTGKPLAGALVMAGTLARMTSKSFTGALTMAGTLTKQIPRALAGAVSFTGTLAASKLVMKSLAGAVGFTGALARQTGKTFTGALVTAGSLTKRTAKSFTGALVLAGTLSRFKLVLKDLAGAVGFTGTLSRQTGKPLAGAAINAVREALDSTAAVRALSGRCAVKAAGLKVVGLQRSDPYATFNREAERAALEMRARIANGTGPRKGMSYCRRCGEQYPDEAMHECHYEPGDPAPGSRDDARLQGSI